MATSSSEGHICQCLGRILALRREAVVTVSDRHGARTGRQFVEGVVELAVGLTRLGIRSGDVVAIAALNSEWYVEWLLAVAYVGAIVAPLNHRWSVEEARAAMGLVTPVMLVVDESCRPWTQELRCDSELSPRYRVLMGESSAILDDDNGSVKSSVKKSVECLSFDHAWAPEDVVLVCFTSGTTGQPKGVTISHMALIVQSFAKIATVGYGEDDVYLHTAPLCHIGGISSCIAMLMSGACHVFIPKFDAKAAADAIEQHHATSLITVPTMVADLASFFRNEGWSRGGSVRKILNGGGSLSHDLVDAVMKIFPNANLISAYGMTEACSSLTFMTLHQPGSTIRIQPCIENEMTSASASCRQGGICVGKPPPHIELQICGNGKNYSPVIGNILTRGSHVMTRYWSKVKAENPERRPNDWLDTGDIGWIDGEGALWLVGRTKDRIKSGGENVYPTEIEGVLIQHPGVSGIAVIGVPDLRLSEMVVACISISRGWAWVNFSDAHSASRNLLSTGILQDHCRRKGLSRFKTPRIYIPWKKPFPYTTTGKLRRDEVKKETISYLHCLHSNL